jgi:hypothetical protein
VCFAARLGNHIILDCHLFLVTSSAIGKNRIAIKWGDAEDPAEVIRPEPCRLAGLSEIRESEENFIRTSQRRKHFRGTQNWTPIIL